MVPRDNGADTILRLEEERGQVATLMSELDSQMSWWERKLGGKALPGREIRQPVGHTHISMVGTWEPR